MLNTNNPYKLALHENPDSGIYISNITIETVKSIEDIDKLMHMGSKHRVTQATKMNDTSSRSHAIFTIYIEKSAEEEDGQQSLRAGKLNLVDLAGSER